MIRLHAWFDTEDENELNTIVSEAIENASKLMGDTKGYFKKRISHHYVGKKNNMKELDICDIIPSEERCNNVLYHENEKDDDWTSALIAIALINVLRKNKHVKDIIKDILISEDDEDAKLMIDEDNPYSKDGYRVIKNPLN